MQQMRLLNEREEDKLMEMMEWISRIMTESAFIVLLGMLAIWDYRYRKVALMPLMAALLLGILNFFLYQPFPVNSILMAGGFGMGLCLLSWLTKGAIGMGDGFVSVLIGIYKGVSYFSVCLCIAFFLAALFSLLLLCFKRGAKKERIAFIPFLFFGYVLTGFLMEGGGIA